MLGDEDETEDPITPEDPEDIFASIDAILSKPSQEDPVRYKPVIEAEEAPEKEDPAEEAILVAEHPIYDGASPEVEITTTESQAATPPKQEITDNKQLTVRSKDMEITVENLSLSFTKEDWEALALTPQQAKLMTFVLQSNILAINNTVQTYKTSESGDEIRKTSRQIQDMALTLASVMAKIAYPNVIESSQKSRGVVYPLS